MAGVGYRLNAEVFLLMAKVSWIDGLCLLGLWTQIKLTRFWRGRNPIFFINKDLLSFLDIIDLRNSFKIQGFVWAVGGPSGKSLSIRNVVVLLNYLEI